MFLVKWQDLSEKVVYRRFTEIYEFHVSVGDREEGGPCPVVALPFGAVGRHGTQPLMTKAGRRASHL
jgi:hypothetical protein